ncbi:CRISPR-associated endoribonuclease Cas6 [Methanococcoides methylutens]|uniref:CRISPR-associated endoribonuclease n=1 Tax=Methanococcoides methylutens MM1 TaxID=1434104 RepID=A0A0E3X0V1_METMT|nr:CRISPR-associated endoribonuclease Cas6 [Methanococcoides methylutens]AKB85835.1 CRISPR repeat RNA endoribonuclease Cas6 [Methanococcoides methylutens MM1]
MRCKITIQKTTSNPIHYDYQYGLASMLYKRLAKANINLANETHSHQGFKFYTFSNLVIEDWIPDKRGLNFSKAHFFISSPDSGFIKSFAEGLFLEPEFFLGRGDNKANFIIERMEILSNPTFGDDCTFKTLSPVYVKTQRKKGDKLVEVDLYPKDSKFYENLHKNITARYKEYYGKEIEYDNFEVLEVTDVKPKRISIGNSYRRCNHLNLTLQANPDLIAFAYDAGLGEKNAMGFGCVDLIELH